MMKRPERFVRWASCDGHWVKLAKSACLLIYLPGLLLSQLAQTPEGRLTMHREQAGSPNQYGWYEAQSTEGNFRVSLPIPFNDFTVAARDKNGKEMVTYGIGSKSAEGYRFSVTEFPRKSITHEIDLKGYPEKLRAKGRRVTNEKYFEFDGQQAVQCQVPDSRTSAVMRVVEFPSGVFILIVEYPTKLETKAMPLVEPFFASLEVTE